MEFNQYDYDKDEIKENITDDQMFDLLSELGAEPIYQGNAIVNKTICHGGSSHKLYYYPNTKLFKCYTDCGGEAWDIFELVRKIKERELGQDYSLPAAVQFVADYFNISPTEKNSFEQFAIREDLIYLNNHSRIINIEPKTQIVELATYDGEFLKNLPRPRLPWEQEGISKETCDYFNICYDPKNCGIVIPHYNIDGGLIGIRERTLGKENSERYGKYMPMKVGNKMYNHPLSFSLYGIYENQENIRLAKKAIVVEGEKSVLQLDSILGREHNIGVACCGSSLITYQVELLRQLGVREIIVGMDRQFQELNDNEHLKLVKNLKNIHKKYGNLITISYLFDKDMITPYKASPTDCGADVFFELYRNKINLY